MKKILIMTADKIGSCMAGPAIRAVEMARFLSRTATITLCARTDGDFHDPLFSVLDISVAQSVIEEMDIIIGHGLFFHKFRFKKRKGQVVIVDLYNIFLTENVICYQSHSPESNFLSYQLDLYKLNYQLMLGDHFLCSNEAQYNFITGMLVALNKVNIKNMEDLPVTLIPFGLEPKPDSFSQGTLKGGYKGIRKEDKVLIWGGGIWDWLDPFTAVKAMASIAKKRDDIKLFFMGIGSPNPDVRVNNAKPLVALAESLGLKDRHVFFNSWVPYDERHNYLMDSDIGLTIHLDTQETRFSNRTRMLDYIRCTLPVLSTKGDTMSELIEKKGLGETVEFGDVEGLAQKILDMVDDSQMLERYRENMRLCRDDFLWSSVLSPLLQLCETVQPSRTGQCDKINYTVGSSVRFNKLQLIRQLLKVRGFQFVWRKLFGLRPHT